MMRLDQALRAQPFRVDRTACFQAASTIRAYDASFVAVPWHHFSTGIQLLFKLLFISICHQINWDFLQNRLAERLLVHDEGNLLERCLQMTPSRMSNMIGDYPQAYRVRAPERASLIKDVAATLLTKFGGKAMRLYERSSGRIVGEGGFLSELDSFRAYQEDPLRKKSNILVQEVVREGILVFQDSDKVAPAIDYHIMRLYLRSGRVVPKERVVFQHLTSGSSQTRLRFVNLLREATVEALRDTAFYAGLTIPTVNYVEWQIGRSRCHRDEPNCSQAWPAGETDVDVARLSPMSCPYSGFCLAFLDPKWRQLQEPTIRKAFY